MVVIIKISFVVVKLGSSLIILPTCQAQKEPGVVWCRTVFEVKRGFLHNINIILNY